MKTGHKTLGILGGMGPLATAYFFERVIALSEAPSDSEHIEVILHSNTRIPDRTQAILHGGVSPAKEMVRSARLLQEAGAELIVMPCITAHYFIDEVAALIEVPILHMVKEAVLWARNLSPSLERIGILATSGTLATGLFQSALEEQGLRTILPTPWVQESLVMEAIYGRNGIKAGSQRGEARNRLLDAAGHLIREGAEAVLAGCTEVPLAIRKEDIPVAFIEPMEIAARLAVERCDGRVKGGSA